MTGFDKRRVGSGVKPGKAAAQDFDMKMASLQISTINVGDFQFAAASTVSAQPQFEAHHCHKIEASYGNIGFRLSRLFLNRERATTWIKLDHAISLRCIDGVAKNCSADSSRGARVRISGNP